MMIHGKTISTAAIFALTVGFFAGVAKAESESTLALVPLHSVAENAPADNARFRPEADQLGLEGFDGGPAVTYSIDFVSGGDVAAVDFTIQVPSLLNGIISDDCVAELPDTHMGRCRFDPASKKLKVVIFSMSNAALPTGSFGQIQVPARAVPVIVKDSVTLSDGQGTKLEAEVL